MSTPDEAEAIFVDQQAMARAFIQGLRVARSNIRDLRSAVSEPVTLVNLIAAEQRLGDAIVALKIAGGERP